MNLKELKTNDLKRIVNTIQINNLRLISSSKKLMNQKEISQACYQKIVSINKKSLKAFEGFEKSKNIDSGLREKYNYCVDMRKRIKSLIQIDLDNLNSVKNENNS